jgi:hypothetical protein
MNKQKRQGCTISSVILLVFAICMCITAGAQHIRNGILDTRHLDLSSSRIQLNGYWKFCPNTLVKPGQLQWSTCSELLVPSLWNEKRGENAITHGTYYLEILLPSTPSGQYALEIPQLYNTYHLFANDSLIARNGTPGVTKETSAPQWMPQHVVLPDVGDTLRLILHLSGFYHHNAGIREPILFGNATAIQSHFNTNFVSTIVEVIVITALSLFFFALWILRNRARISLYFALFCLSWSIREMFSDIYPISTIVPGINWFFLVRTEYIMLFLIVSFAISFINRLFPELTSTLFKYMIVAINMLFIAYTVFAPVDAFTAWLPFYIVVATITLVYVCIITVRALIHDKTGAWPLTIGLLLMIVTSAYDVIAYKAAIANNIFVGNIAYCLIFISCGIGLLQHLNILGPGHSDNRLRYQDLYK